MNRASGNARDNSPMRPVCVGLLMTNGRPVAVLTASKNLSQTRQPVIDVFARNAVEVQVLHIHGTLIRKRDASIRRRHAHIQQGEFVFLGAIPSGGHVVHRTFAGQHPLTEAAKRPFGNQEMMRRKTLISRRAAEPFITHHQFVQQRGSAPPVADDKHGGAVQFGVGELTPKNRLLHQGQHRVAGGRHELPNT